MQFEGNVLRRLGDSFVGCEHLAQGVDECGKIFTLHTRNNACE